MATGSSKISLDQLIASTARIYKAVEPFLEAKEKVDFAADAYSQASTAMSTGHLSANDETIEQARAKAHGLSSSLSSLARKDENYWIAKSPANLLQKATVTAGVNWLQQKSKEFADMQRMMDGQLPLVQGLKNVYANPGVKGLRNVVLGPTTLHELDDWALQEIETSLKASISHVRQIQSKLENAKNALLRWR
jgi:hypothetical protein